MLIQHIASNNGKFRAFITIKTTGKKVFKCFANDYGRKNSKYADRIVEVEGTRTIFFSFPITPKTLTLVIYNLRNKEDKDFSVTIDYKPLEEYQIWLDQDARDFLPLAIYFSQVCGFEPGSVDGRKFTTKDNEFRIKYFPVIRDYMTGNALSTPARIGHQSGIIECSKAKMDCYTIPMRMIILLHEFSHKYRNPKMGLEISNETGADINALYIYLGLGFSKVDAIYVFANVFLKAQTEGNIQRMRKIMDYIQRFENQEEAKLI